MLFLAVLEVDLRPAFGDRLKADEAEGDVQTPQVATVIEGHKWRSV
jgi:hypothetical protein